MHPYPPELASFLDTASEDSRALIEKAYAFAKETHKNHLRLSGEPYITHSLETARTLAALRVDPDTVAAGLLHDTLGENEVTQETLTKEFGEEISELVRQHKELDSLRYQGSERYAENLRKMMMVSAKDVRVLILRLAHRLHNVRTLNSLPEEKRIRIARETIDIYAPISNRLGMRKLTGELEDASFPHAFPTEYALTLDLLKEKEGHSMEQLQAHTKELREALEKAGINSRILSRQKQLFSLYKKLEKYDYDIQKLKDLHGLRVITPTLGEAYQALGVVHALWNPVPGKISDYIAQPKPNGYQSIHTEVFTGDGTITEVQIRTEEMDTEAEYGIASHLAYTETGKQKSGGRIGKKLQWVKQLLDWQKSNTDPEEFLEELRTDFFQDRIFTYTPKGDVIELPEGASTIDFAYAIHSDIGAHAAGAHVNGKFVGLDERLKNGDLVEITTRKNSVPSTKWLEYAKTSLARRQIRGAANSKPKNS